MKKTTKKTVVRVIENENGGYYAKLGRLTLKPVSGHAATLGEWANKDSARRNLRKRLPTLGYDVGTFVYKYENA